MIRRIRAWARYAEPIEFAEVGYLLLVVTLVVSAIVVFLVSL